jgi:signal transduction histidine kinase
MTRHPARINAWVMKTSGAARAMHEAAETRSIRHRGGTSCCSRCSTTALENARLRARVTALQGSGARIVETGDSDRRQLERDLHDGAQQRLVTLSLTLSALASRPAADAESARMLVTAREELAASLQELRDLAHGLHPATLRMTGLSEALRSVTLRAPVPVALTVTTGTRLPEPVEVAVYYLVSEALTNIAKYAGATKAAVRVSDEDDRVIVEISDDGIGGADPASGSGLRGLAARLEMLGGRLRISSPPHGGTHLQAEIPCVPISEQPTTRSDHASQ